jgi:ribosomal protein L34
VQDWRARMQTGEARAIFARRKLIERIHAHYM